MRRKKEKTRVKSRYDELPEEIKKLIDDRLADINNSYTSIAEEVKALGYEISRSSIGRLALRRNEENKEVTMRLKIAKEQAKIAADMSKDSDAIGYMKGIIHIAMNEITNRLLTASSDEYDEVRISQIYNMFSKLVRDMTNISRFEFAQDKGFASAYAAFEKLTEQYFGNDPEIREKILAKVAQEAQHEIQK